MDTIERIIDILAWPVTTITLVAMLRTPLSELIATLKKLKYKELELEFEKEARQILAEAERDLPKPPKIESRQVEDTEIRFQRFRMSHVEPATQI